MKMRANVVIRSANFAREGQPPKRWLSTPALWELKAVSATVGLFQGGERFTFQVLQRAFRQSSAHDSWGLQSASRLGFPQERGDPEPLRSDISDPAEIGPTRARARMSRVRFHSQNHEYSDSVLCRRSRGN
jgi:hypothetical protein